MKVVLIAAALISAVNGLATKFNAKESPLAKNGELCSKWREDSLENVPWECFRWLVCTGDHPYDGEDCPFDWKSMDWSQKTMLTYSRKCLKFLMCPEAGDAEKLRLTREKKEKEAKEKEAASKDILVPYYLLVKSDVNEFGRDCSIYADKVWYQQNLRCLYNNLCIKSKGNGKQCDNLDPKKKQYSFRELFQQPEECVREILCKRGYSKNYFS